MLWAQNMWSLCPAAGKAAHPLTMQILHSPACYSKVHGDLSHCE